MIPLNRRFSKSVSIDFGDYDITHESFLQPPENQQKGAESDQEHQHHGSDDQDSSRGGYDVEGGSGLSNSEANLKFSDAAYQIVTFTDFVARAKNRAKTYSRNKGKIQNSKYTYYIRL